MPRKLTALRQWLLVSAGCIASIAAADNTRTQVWQLDKLQTVGGHAVEVSGNPQTVVATHGPVVSFDGDGDQLLVDNNPLAGATEFTIEVVFFPRHSYPSNIEPRFLHIEDPTEPDRRVTIELRLNHKQQWYLDAFIKSELSQFTLVDPALIHPVDQWAHAAIIYQAGQFTSYVNGQQELTAKVDYQAIATKAKTSLGARMNQMHWFNGKIAQVRITQRALTPSDFNIPKYIGGTCEKVNMMSETSFTEFMALF